MRVYQHGSGSTVGYLFLPRCTVDQCGAEGPFGPIRIPSSMGEPDQQQQKKKSSLEVPRRRLRLCSVCGMKKHQHYMQTFTENVPKREEWIRMLCGNDPELMENQKQKLQSYGRKFICYDHFTPDQFETPAMNPYRALILKRNAVPTRYEPKTFKPNLHLLNSALPTKKLNEAQAPPLPNLLVLPPQISPMEFLLQNIEVYSNKIIE